MSYPSGTHWKLIHNLPQFWHRAGMKESLRVGIFCLIAGIVIGWFIKPSVGRYQIHTDTSNLIYLMVDTASGRAWWATAGSDSWKEKTKVKP